MDAQDCYWQRREQQERRALEELYRCMAEDNAQDAAEDN